MIYNFKNDTLFFNRYKKPHMDEPCTAFLILYKHQLIFEYLQIFAFYVWRMPNFTQIAR